MHVYMYTNVHTNTYTPYINTTRRRMCITYMHVLPNESIYLTRGYATRRSCVGSIPPALTQPRRLVSWCTNQSGPGRTGSGTDIRVGRRGGNRDFRRTPRAQELEGGIPNLVDHVLDLCRALRSPLVTSQRACSMPRNSALPRRTLVLTSAVLDSAQAAAGRVLGAAHGSPRQSRLRAHVLPRKMRT